MKTAKQKAKSNPDQPHTNSAITPPEQNEHGLPEGWRWVKLGEVCNFIGGGTPSKKESKYWNGNVSWASVKDIKGDYLNSTEDRITNLGLKESASNIAEPGELILITRILPGRSIITNIRTAINQDLKVVKPKFQASPKFLHYYFKAFERELIKKSSGTTVLGITLNNLNEIEIPLLDIATQDKLVSKIEELLSELDKGKQQLKVYRQAVLKWAFEGKLSESMSESEFSGLQNDRKMSESELAKLMNEQNGKPSESNSVKSSHSVNSASDNLPKGWKWVKVKEVAETVGGYAFKSGDFIEEGKFQVLRMGNVRPGVLRYDESPVFINDIEEAVLTKSMLKVNDVIIIQTGTRKKRDYGFTALIPKENLLLNQRIAAIRFRTEYLPKFFLYFSWTDFFKDQFFANETGNVGQGNVGMKAVTETLLPLCSVQEQHLIVQQIESRLSVCDKVEETISQSLAQAETLRQSILKKAFEGKLV